MSHHAGVGAKTLSALSMRLQIQKVHAEITCLAIVLKKSVKRLSSPQEISVAAECRRKVVFGT